MGRGRTRIKYPRRARWTVELVKVYVAVFIRPSRCIMTLMLMMMGCSVLQNVGAPCKQ